MPTTPLDEPAARTESPAAGQAAKPAFTISRDRFRFASPTNNFDSPDASLSHVGRADGARVAAAVRAALGG